MMTNTTTTAKAVYRVLIECYDETNYLIRDCDDEGFPIVRWSDDARDATLVTLSVAAAYAIVFPMAKIEAI